MTLQDIYDQLAYGELRELFLGGAGIDTPNDGIDQEQFKRLLPHITLGLTALHTRFALREGSMTIPLVDGKVTYILAPKKDAPAGYAEDLLGIERVYGIYNSKKYEITLDDLDDFSSIRKTSVDTLIVPTDENDAPWLAETTELVVQYRADHPKISVPVANAAPLVTAVYLPATHLWPLCLFIASRVHNPIGMVPGAVHEGNNYAMKYEQAVQQLSDLGMQLQADTANTRIRDNGWV